MVNRSASDLHLRSIKSKSDSSTATSKQSQNQTNEGLRYTTDNFLLPLQQINENMRQTTQLLSEVVEAGSRLSENLANTMDVLARINTGAIWEAIHDYHKQYRLYVAEDRKVLDEQQFHLHEFWVRNTMLQVFGIHQVHPEEREEKLHLKLMSLIENKEFDNELKSCAVITPELQERLPIIEQALEAHRSEKYLVAIPSLLAQFEGLLVDYLAKKKVLVIVNNRPKQLKNLNNPKKGWLRGLKDVAGEIEASETELYGFHGVADHVVDRLADERNDIMHGRKNDYDNAQLSVNLIMHVSGLFRSIHMIDVWKRLSAAQARRSQSNS